MLFKPDLCEKILADEKTQTRRVAKPNERFLRRRRENKYCSHPSEVLITDKSGFERLKWQEGRCYAVQPGRGRKAIAYIRINELRKEKLCDMGENDAIAEGVTPNLGEHYLSAFARLWDSINPNHLFRSNPDVWVIDFELAFRTAEYGDLRQ